MPYRPLTELTVSPCMREVTMVRVIPATGPKAKVPMRIGISAGSYSRNATAGKIGK